MLRSLATALCLSLPLVACTTVEQPSRNEYALYEAALRAGGNLRTEIEPEDAPFSNADLVTNFHRIALHHEADIERDGSEENSVPNRLGRWEQDINYRLVGSGVTPETELEVREFARRLERLTGRSFRPAEEDINFLILITDPDERPEVADMLGEVMPALGRSFDRWRQSKSLICVATNLYRNTSDDRIVFGMVMMGSELGPLMRSSCLHEELVQALGLGNDHSEVRPSIFNDDEEFALLTRHDEYLLRILYDPRLKSGMTAAEAMPIVREIIADLRPDDG
ncbi:MAG TPA: DUF2927 domain-containing protein [Thermohalobaculum sp.]|nr:DUF2927 domain-containing protein [Thermohalobaculum sp.]